MKSYPVGPSLHLVSVTVPRAEKAVPKPQPTNHVVVIDCSGSMWNDLPLIREQLKGKLPKLLAEKDTISLIWFSGRGQYGTLVKGEPVATLKDLSDLNKAIDRWLKPVCLTGFKEPLQEAEKIVDELGGICSLFFMSDGYDNQWRPQEILDAMAKLSTKVASTTVVEYGYYCNHPLMVKMAETAGGVLILNEDFKRYEPNFESAMKKQALGAKRIEVPLGADAVKGFAYVIDDGALLTFSVESGKVSVPEHISEVWFLSPAPVGTSTSLSVTMVDTLSAVYAAIALYSQRAASDVVFPLLKTSGDVRLINLFAGCFGKQKYAAFVDEATRATFNTKLRLIEGYDPSAVPDDNAFTLLDLLDPLSHDDENYVLLDSKDFKYNKIGRPRVAEPELDEEEQKAITALEAQLEGADATTTKTLKKKIAAVVGPKLPPPFKAEPMPKGVLINHLTFNEVRPNVSILVRREGTADLKLHNKPPKGRGKRYPKVPDKLPTYIHRNYAIIRDGLVNVDRLPIRMTAATLKKLLDAGMPESVIQNPSEETREQTMTRVRKASKEREINLVLDLRSLPVINRSMVTEVSARTLFELQYELTQARAEQKVLNTIFKENFGGKISQGFNLIYGEEEASWLKELGITDYNGYNPGGKQAKAQDSYMGKELHVALKGYSTLPSLADVRKRVASGKHTVTSSLMIPHLEAVEGFLASDAYKGAADPSKVFKAWLESQQKAATKRVRALLYKVSKIRFGVIVGQIWFKEFNSFDEDTLEFEVGDLKLKGTVTMKEIEVPI